MRAAEPCIKDGILARTALFKTRGAFIAVARVYLSTIGAHTDFLEVIASEGTRYAQTL